jgi:hypothetical protein
MIFMLISIWLFCDVSIEDIECHDRMINECRAASGIRIGRANQSIRRRAVPEPLRSPQIPYDMLWKRAKKQAG